MPILICCWFDSEKEANEHYLKDEVFNKLMKEVVNRVNKNLSAIEKVRKFIIAKEPFTIENKMMTPTLKIRRFQVIEKYGDELSSLY